VPLLRPFTQSDQMPLKPVNGIAQRPRFPFVRRAITIRIVARGMAFGAIGVKLDLRRAEIAAGPLGRPLGYCINGEEIVTVYA